MKHQREEKWIPMVTSENYPRRFLFVDTETYNEPIDDKKHYFKLKLGVCIYTELDKQFNVKKHIVHRFYTIEDFCDILMSHVTKRNILYIVGHNIGFDIRVLNLPHELHWLGFESTPPIINGRIFIWSNASKQGSLKFIDTANFGATTLEALGKDIGLEKLSVDFEEVTDEQLFIYCQRDNEIVEKFILLYHHFIRDNELGSFQLTLASQSLTAWRKRFMSQSVFIHNYEPALQLERRGYHGGRVECWKLGEFTSGEFYNLDVNSMYPYVMDTFELPYELKRVEENLFVPELKKLMNKFYCIAEVTLDTDIPAYALLNDEPIIIQSYVPISHKHELLKIPRGRLLFPIGQYKVVLHHAELEYAIANKHIKQIHKVCSYYRAPIFKDYIEFFNTLKVKSTIDGNKSWRYIAKLFSVSLYGKFGQMNVERTVTGETNPETIWRVTGWAEKLNKNIVDFAWFGKVYTELKEGESVYSSPAIAGAITAYSRMVLFNYASQAGFENVYYMDTDSLIVSRAGYDNLTDVLDNTTLGKLKLVSSGTELKIFGNKDYEFAGEIRHKGIPSKAKEIEIDKKYTSKKAEKLSIQLGELQRERAWEFLQFEGFITWLNSEGNRPPIGTIKHKRRIQKYNKGIVDDKGNVTPIVLGE